MRRWMCLTLVVFVGFVGLGTIVPVPAVARDSSARVALTTAGSSPRSPLRLKLEKGAVHGVRIEMVEDIEQSTGGAPRSVHSPPMQMTMTMTVEDVDRSGTADVVSAYSNVAVVDDGSVTADQRSALTTTLAALSNVSITGQVTARNEYVSGDVSGIDDVDPAIASIMTQVSDQSDALTIPFPKEAVGVGARWRSTSHRELAGIKVTQTYDVTLTSRQGDHVTMDVVMHQTAPVQRADLPGLPAGSKVTVTSLTSKGTGTLDLQLTSPVLSGGHQQATTAQVFAIKAKGQSVVLTQKATITTTYSPA